MGPIGKRLTSIRTTVSPHLRFAVLLSVLSAVLFSVLVPGANRATAEELTAAVAANFVSTMQVLTAQFQAESGHRVRVISGSTGKHYAQIRQGAPYDLFFAADAARPQRLAQEGRAVAESRFTYAVGRLVLWSPAPGRITREGTVLVEGDFRRLAIANPKLAPYGMAAQEVLMRLEIWPLVKNRLVLGTNISQTLQFVETGAADFGFVALAQVQQPGKPIAGSYWLVPQTAHTPIEQQAVIINDSEAARAFMHFVQSPWARQTIQSHGYGEANAHHES